MKKILRIIALVHAVALTVLLSISAVHAQTVVDAWDTVKAPPAPELKSVTLDPKSTAVLLLDFNKQTCSAAQRPRCIASIPKVAKLLAEARGKGVLVVYSLSAGATTADIGPELAPKGNEPVVASGPDKFLGTDLEKILKEKNIKTVIVNGTAAHGAVLYTASEAAFRGMKVIIPVDGLSAEALYPEQYTVWTLANAPRVSAQVTLTKIDMIKF
jgi:nicotinamidase-related amidase